MSSEKMMFSADVHGITKVEKIAVEKFAFNADDPQDKSGYVTITLRSDRHHQTTKYTFFANDLDNVWETFGNAMIKADAVYENKYGEKTDA